MSDLPMCPFCLAAWGDIGTECSRYHTDRISGVARQIAALIHEAEPTDEQVGWFMEDAETVCAVVTEPVPVVRAWEPKTQRLRVESAVFRVDDEGGLLPVPPRSKKVAR